MKDKHDKHIWNMGYFAGHRHMIMIILAYRDTGGRMVCKKCGKEEIVQRLHIHEKNPPPLKSNGDNYRSYDDWCNLDNLDGLLCIDCHSETESWCKSNKGES